MNILIKKLEKELNNLLVHANHIQKDSKEYADGYRAAVLDILESIQVIKEKGNA